MSDRRVATIGMAVALLMGSSVRESVGAEATGGLDVRVTDRETGGAVSGASITVSREASGPQSRRALTDRSGLARIDGVPAPGVYVVLVRADGYATVAVQNVAVAPGPPKVLPVVIWKAVEETVTIVDRPRVVDLEEVAPTSRFSGDFLEDLPILGRDVQAMLPLAPGVQDADGDGNPNVHGARERDFKLMLGDVSNQDPLTGLYLGFVNPDTIEDLEVFPVGGGAEFGRAQGGFARVVQKQGNNDFEGVAGFSLRTWRLDGNGASSQPLERIPRFDTFLPFVQFSGPIVRDRLWYRLSAEHRSEDEPLSLPGYLAVKTHRQTIADGQMALQATPRTKVTLHVRHDPYADTNLGVAPARSSEAAWKLDFDGTTYALATTSSLSPTTLLESTTALQRYEERVGPMTRGIDNDCVRGYEFIEAAQCFSLASGLYSGSYNDDRADSRQRMTFLGKVSHYARGGHQLRGGASVEAERFTRWTNSRPFMTFEIKKPGQFEGVASRLDFGPPYGLSATSIAVPIESERRAQGSSSALWVEDQFRPRANLSITVGLRYEREEISAVGFEPFDPRAEHLAWQAIATGDAATDAVPIQTAFTRYEALDAIPSMLAPLIGFRPSLSAAAAQTARWERARRPANIELRHGALSPRLALSWDPFADGKTKVALTAGRYYDKTYLAVPLVETDPAVVSLLYTSYEFEDEWWITQHAGTVNPGISIRQVDRDLRPPHQDEFSIAFEREIAPEVLVRVVGIARRFEDQLQDIDLNRTTGDEGSCRIMNALNERYVVSSPGSGFTVADAYTGEIYTDTDPGPGDGRLDDCGGSVAYIITPRGNGARLPRPDGRPDLYLQNPAWGSVLRVGNYNRARYHGVVVELVRRMWRNWQMEASYTWSRALGDAEDFLQTLGNDRSVVEDERGFLSYDQRHVFKMNAAFVVPRDFRLGLAASWQSGLPFSVVRQRISQDSIAPSLFSLSPPDPSLRTSYEDGGRNTKRNRSYWNFDVQAVRELRPRRGVNVRLSADVFNLLNDDTYIVYSPELEYGRRLHGLDEAYRRFGRRFQLGVRVAF